MNRLDPILRPLARLSIRKGWLFPHVIERLRRAYIAAAQREAGLTATDSKLSIMTGLQRREVARLRTQEAVPPKPSHPAAAIIARWWDDPAYPVSDLPITGEGATFGALARSIRKDVHPRTFLDVLIDCGAVTEADNTVSLHTRNYQPSKGTDDQLTYLAHNVGDHFETAVENVSGQSDTYDLAVHYNGLSAEGVARIEALFAERMNAVLHDIDTLIQTMPDAGGAHRFRAGGYFHSSTTEDDPS